MPTHITPAAFPESDSAVIAPCGDGVTPEAYLPTLAGTAHDCRVRSGLMRVQLLPLFALFQTTFDT